jgi:hypothetical protein
MKHNKKRNTAFIYEALTRELTKAIVDKDTPRKNKVISVLKEFFSQGQILAEELRLYKTLLDTRNVKSTIAERLVVETKKAYSSLEESAIFDAQSRLIAAINKGLGQEVWSNFVPNFKALASVNSIFSTKTTVKKRVLFEQALVDEMSMKQKIVETKEMKPLDTLAYKSFIKKFNEKYGDLLQEQQALLNRYITSFADEGFELRLYLNTELARLKTTLTEAANNKEEVITEKISGVVEYLDGFRKREFTDTDLNKVLQAQELAVELTSHDHN